MGRNVLPQDQSIPCHPSPWRPNEACVRRLIKGALERDDTSYLYSAKRSTGRAEQIGQGFQTSLLWLWSRSNSLPFPEALSAMTQGFHYRHNQKPSFHQAATQTSSSWKIQEVLWVFSCVRIHAWPWVAYWASEWQTGLTKEKSKNENVRLEIVNYLTMVKIAIFQHCRGQHRHESFSFFHQWLGWEKNL